VVDSRKQLDAICTAFQFPLASREEIEMTTFPHPIEAGNTRDGAPLTLGDPEQLADLFVDCSGSGYLLVSVFDLNGDGRKK
jgi:hypothetical protein